MEPISIDVQREFDSNTKIVTNANPSLSSRAFSSGQEKSETVPSKTQ